jgi:hypothetical protein
MMTDVDELVQQAQAAKEAGDLLVARGYWRRAANAAPDRLDIWLELCRVTQLPAEKVRCLENVVRLDPDNAEAKAELTRLQDDRPVDQVPGADLDVEESQVPKNGHSHSHSHVYGSEVIDVRPDVTDEMRLQWDRALAAGEPLVCINHPQRETTLRCNRCGVPICTQCAVRTPVGFRCTECVRSQQAQFYTAHWYDYVIAGVLSLVLSVPGAVLAGWIGWFFALIMSPFAGGLIGGLVHRAIGRRRGRWIWLTVAVCVVLGALIVLLFRPVSFLPIGIYAVAATASAMGILRLGRSR